MTTKKETAEPTPVLVTTEHRGVFFGYLTGDAAKEKITLERARNCLYWTADVRGFVGLAESGPTAGCRVGPVAPKLTLFGITSVIECTPKAVARWEASPWG
jgi:hypothetical protein